MKKRILSLLSIPIAGYLFALSYYWESAWSEYRDGGGVFINKPVFPKRHIIARKHFTTHSNLNPFSVSSLNYIGKSYILTEEYEKAELFFKKSLSRRNNFAANYRLAYIEMKRSNFENMITYLKKAERFSTKFSNVVRFSEEFGHLKGTSQLSGFEKHW